MRMRDFFRAFVLLAVLGLCGFAFNGKSAAGAVTNATRPDPAIAYSIEVIETEESAGLYRVAPDGAKTLLYASGPGGIPEDLAALSPDGRYAAFVEMLPSADWTIKSRVLLSELASGATNTIIESGAADWYTNPVWSPGSRVFAFIRVDMQKGGTALMTADVLAKAPSAVDTQGTFAPPVLVYKTGGLRWSTSGDAILYQNEPEGQWYALDYPALAGALPHPVTPPEQPGVLQEFQLMAYNGMQKPVNVRDYDNTCGNGYTGLYPDYGGCVFTGGHPGLDLSGISATLCGQPAYAICDGTISAAAAPSGVTPSGSACGNNYRKDYYVWPKHLGNYAILRCDDIPNADLDGITYGGTIYTVYAHLSSLSVSSGQSVSKGQQIGLIGSTGNSTGPHLHFQMEKTTQSVHPGYWTDYGQIAAYTWNPMYFIQAHTGGTPPSNDRIVNPPPLNPATASCSYAWQKVPAGSYGNAYDVYLTANAETAEQSTNYARWTPNLPVKGLYKVKAYIGNHAAGFCGMSPAPQWDTSSARYKITYSGGTKTVAVDQSPLTNEWVTIDTQCFEAGTAGSVKLPDLTYEPALSRTVSFSAMKFEYVGSCEAPPPTCYSLGVAVLPGEGGNLSVDPAPNCNNGTQYTSGTVVWLNATPAAGYRFVKWSGSNTNTEALTNVTMNADKAVTANFEKLCYTLGLSVSPSGGGTIAANPLPNCNNATQYSHGTLVALTAQPAAGYIFQQWTGSASGTSPSASITMNGSRNASASFQKRQRVYLPMIKK